MVYDLPTKLKLERVKRNLSQQEVADAVHVKKSAISQYETGATNPPTPMIAKLAAFYGVSADYLLGLESRKAFYVDDLNNSQIEALERIAHEFKKDNENAK